MEKLQKGIISLALVICIIIILGLIGGGAYIYKNNTYKNNIRQSNLESFDRANVKIMENSVFNFQQVAELIYDRKSKTEGYSGICEDGLINVDVNADPNFSWIVREILSTQGLFNQSNANIVCVAIKEKYALEIKFGKEFNVMKNINSYCVDSSGARGDNTRFKIDRDNFKCKPQ